jgi:transposase
VTLQEETMKKQVHLREVTAEENAELRRLAGARKESIRMVQRARILVTLLDDPEISASDAALRAGFCAPGAGPLWVRRFNAEGLAGLQDRPRSGRKPTHGPHVRSALIDLALQKPRSLGYPFELWTLERLQGAFEERQGTHLSDSTIWTWLAEEGLEWKRQQSWFRDADQHDAEFVEKRGPLSRLISCHPHERA